jgi:thiol-disulfide isomerase/thioredoxin
VTFYANWCPYSRKFFEPFEQIAAEAGAKYPEMTFAQFDCGKSKEHKDICFEKEADHYPELMLWQDGHLQELAFPRVKPAILAYIDKHMSPLSATVTCDELKLKMEDNPFSLVYFGSQSTDLYNTFMEFGKFERDETSIFLFDAPAECASEYDGQSDSIMMYRKDFKSE